ncbi:substrate-binding periplasmic protein [Salidesulfovibrio onnuriiensis]|uniref:substrate-binding periplasmic protein n=1 Tax=Salidesulfovibrio onnuriiensis TaxID=2583823 RepID=UPI00164F151F|nr:transporter substrate-binding domain-containing protein [Salidesulfovibrio onnuriiensis]
MKALFPILLAAMALFLPPGTTHAYDINDLSIYTEEYPPYNYREDKKVAGTSTEIVLEILQRLGSKLQRENIQLVPWARAYEAVQYDTNAIIYSMAHTEHRADLFKWACPVGRVRIGLIAPKAKHIVIRCPEDLRRYRIGVVREDIGHQLMRKIISDRDMDIANSSEQNMRKLLTGRIDLFSYDLNVARDVLRRLGLDPDQFETVYVLEEQDLCIGFHMDADDELVRAFQRTLDEINREKNTP